MYQDTEKLYDADSHATRFTATVLSSVETPEGAAVILDRTLFFPEEGGQSCDTGTLGDARVRAVRIDGKTLIHLVDRPLPVGETLTGEIDWAPRFRKMQHHTGEHLLSGLAHRLYQANNVGFHLGESDVTMDLDRDLGREELDRIEFLANEAVAKNLPVEASYPAPEALKTIEYRSKLDLSEGVRIVTIPGYDACACCAPHVSRTGEIGQIKILDSLRYKGGVRLHIVCGMDALLDYRARYRQILSLSCLLSAKQPEVVPAVQKLQSDLIAGKQRENRLKNALADAMLSLAPEEGGKHRLYFSELLDPPFLRSLVNRALPGEKGICAAFNGNDETGYRYVMASETVDLRAFSSDFHRALTGRGGGSQSMIQGSVSATENEIRNYFASCAF